MILRALLPQTPRARSGDLGEILASELVKDETNLRLPVRRMRFKDGREVVMRGDDFIGVGRKSAGKWPRRFNINPLRGSFRSPATSGNKSDTGGIKWPTKITE